MDKIDLTAVIGVIGGLFTSLFGGWDTSIQTLFIFMAVDYLTGLIVAGVFHNSKKTQNGALTSKNCWIGLSRKGVTLLIVLVANRLDMLVGTNYVRDGVCIAYIINEVISIIENADLMGIPVPEILKRAIDTVKGGKQNENK